LLNNPYFVAVDSTRDPPMLVVSETDNLRSVELYEKGIVRMAGIGSGAARRDGRGTNARFNMPFGVAFSHSGSERKLYVIDRSNKAVRMIKQDEDNSQSGVSVLGGPTPSPQTATPTLTPRPTSSPSQRFKRMVHDTTEVYTMATNVLGSIAKPTAMVANTISKWLYFTGADCSLSKINMLNNTVVKLPVKPGCGNVDGAFSNAQFGVIKNLVLDLTDPRGEVLYMVDYAYNKIREVEVNTNVVDTVAGSGSSGHTDGDFLQSRFNSPGGVCVQTKGRKAGFPILFITDQLNHRIRALHRDQLGMEVKTIAGTGARSIADGSAATSKFNNPIGIDIDEGASSGPVLYIADSGNHRIRALNLQSQIVTTVAGAGSAASVDGSALSARFHTPHSVLVNKRYQPPQLYVLQSIQKVRLVDLSDNSVHTYAGSGTSGTIDGAGTGARFRSLWEMAYNVYTNRLYVADYNAHSIRYIADTGPTPSPTVCPTTRGPTFAPTKVGAVLNFHPDFHPCIHHSTDNSGRGQGTCPVYARRPE